MTTKMITMTAMFVALITILAQISIPIGPVPVNFAHIGIFVGAALLGPKLGTASIGIYLVIGMMGIPVFSGFSGGFGIVAGPTGGFLIGYLFCAWITATLIKLTRTYLVPMTVGLFVNYLVGIPWLMFITAMDFHTALAISVFPFLLGDGIKILMSSMLVKRLRHLYFA